MPLQVAMLLCAWFSTPAAAKRSAGRETHDGDPVVSNGLDFAVRGGVVGSSSGRLSSMALSTRDDGVSELPPKFDVPWGATPTVLGSDLADLPARLRSLTRHGATQNSADEEESQLEVVVEHVFHIAASRTDLTAADLRQRLKVPTDAGRDQEGPLSPRSALRALGILAKHPAADAELLEAIAVACGHALHGSGQGTACEALDVLGIVAESPHATDLVHTLVMTTIGFTKVSEARVYVHALGVLTAVLRSGAASGQRLRAVDGVVMILDACGRNKAMRRTSDAAFVALSTAAHRREADAQLLLQIVDTCQATLETLSASAQEDVAQQALEVAKAVAASRSANAEVLSRVVGFSTNLLARSTTRQALLAVGEVTRSDGATPEVLIDTLQVPRRIAALPNFDPASSGVIFWVLEHAARNVAANGVVLGEVSSIVEDLMQRHPVTMAIFTGSLKTLVTVASSNAATASHIDQGARICEGITRGPVTVIVALKAFKALRILARSNIASVDCLTSVMRSTISLLKKQQFASSAKLEALAVFQEIAANRASSFALLKLASQEIERVANWCTPECVEEAQLALVTITLGFTSRRFDALGERRAAQAVRSLLSVASRSRGHLGFPRADILCPEILRMLAQTPRLLHEAAPGLKAAGLTLDIVSMVGAFLVEPEAAMLYARAPIVCADVATADVTAAPLRWNDGRFASAGSLITREMLHATCSDLPEVAVEAALAFAKVARQSKAALWTITGRDLVVAGECLRNRPMFHGSTMFATKASALLDGASETVRWVPRERSDFAAGLAVICEAARAHVDMAVHMPVVENKAFVAKYAEVCDVPAIAL